MAGLNNSGHLSKKLAEMAHQIRQIRNWGAHDTDEEEDVTEGDIPILLDFVEAIIEYFYVSPAKIEKVRRRLDKKE